MIDVIITLHKSKSYHLYRFGRINTRLGARKAYKRIQRQPAHLFVPRVDPSRISGHQPRGSEQSYRV